MTLGVWLDSRSPEPPAALAERLDEVLGARREVEVSAAPAVLVETAAELLRDLLARPSVGRESALDLLAVDALVTYAFEAASDAPATLRTHATGAMGRLAAVARE